MRKLTLASEAYSKHQFLITVFCGFVGALTVISIKAGNALGSLMRYHEKSVMAGVERDDADHVYSLLQAHFSQSMFVADHAGELLCLAAKNDDRLRMLKWLLQKRVCPNSQNEWSETPLIIAIKSDAKQCVGELLQHDKNNLDTLGHMGRTALHHACLRDNAPLVVKFFSLSRERWPRVDVPDICQKTPLHIAAHKGNTDIIALMLQYSKLSEEQITKMKTRCGKTVLHLAALSKVIGSAEILLKSFPNLINEPDGQGSTPLHYAVEQGLLAMVQLFFITFRAHAVKNHAGFTPIDIAVSKGRFGIVHFFVHQGYKIPDSLDTDLLQRYPETQQSLSKESPHAHTLAAHPDALCIEIDNSVA